MNTDLKKKTRTQLFLTLSEKMKKWELSGLNHQEQKVLAGQAKVDAVIDEMTDTTGCTNGMALSFQLFVSSKLVQSESLKHQKLEELAQKKRAVMTQLKLASKRVELISQQIAIENRKLQDATLMPQGSNHDPFNVSFSNASSGKQ